MQCQQQQSEKINFKLHLQHRALMEHITDLKYILGVADRKYAKPCQKGTWEEKTTMFCPSDLGKLID